MCALPQNIAEIRSRCIGCRSCLKVCPSYHHGGCSPFLAMNGDDPKLTSCIGCGKCSEVCRHSNPKLVMMHLKHDVLGLSVPEQFLKHGLVMPKASDDWKKEVPEMERDGDIYIMPGCVTQAKLPYLKYAACRAFKAVGVDAAELPGNICCMYPLPLRGMSDADRTTYKKELRAKAAGKDMVALCAGCTIELGLSAVHAPHVSTYFSKYLDRIRALPGAKLKVAVEPGCSCERYLTDFMEIVKATGAEVMDNTYGCCGKAVPGVNSELMEERQSECEGADAIILGCPNCQVFYDNVPNGIPVLHLTELIALAAGDSETQKFHKLKLRV